MTRMIALGDSIFQGWDGKESVNHDLRIPEQIGKKLGWQVDNEAIGGRTLSGDSDDDFVGVTNRINFANFDVCLMNYGVNDFSFVNAKLAVLQDHLAQGVQKMRRDNHDIRIMYELPTQDFRFDRTTLDQTGPGGWSQNQMIDSLIDECNKLNIAYYDWRSNPLITYQNANETLGDGNTGVHPTVQTMAKIADRLAAWMNPNGLVGYYTINLQNIYSRISELYGDVNSVFMNNEVQEIKFEPIDNPTGERNLAVYLWTVKSLQNLEDALNRLVGMFNGYSLVDVTTGQSTDFIKLWIPILDLTLDNDYEKKLDDDFKLANELLDQLFEYIKPYIKG